MLISEIMNLKPCDETDVLFCEKVLGWAYIPENARAGKPSWKCPLEISYRTPLQVSRSNEATLEALFKVLCKCLSVKIHRMPDCWTCSVSDDYKTSHSHDPDFSMAFVKACLLWVNRHYNQVGLTNDDMELLGEHITNGRTALTQLTNLVDDFNLLLQEHKNLRG